MIEALREAEQRHGGLTSGIVTTRSPHEQKKRNPGSKMRGGDRMTLHNYAPVYAKHLPHDPRLIIEIGVLRGTGLFMWRDIFPKARIVGLDYDLYNYVPKPGYDVEVYRFDKYTDTLKFFGKPDVVIDDADHSTESIIKCWEQNYSYLAQNFVYFIEDNDQVHKVIDPKNCDMMNYGRITVLWR
jgi:hypothetical protein